MQSPCAPIGYHHTYSKFTTTTEAYAHELYSGALGDELIDTFLEETKTYDSLEKTWSVPCAPETSEDLVRPFYRVLSSIVKRFATSTTPGVQRKVVDARRLRGGEKVNADGYRTCPVIAVQAAGPSFQLPAPPALPSSKPSNPLGFANMATYFSVKLNADAGQEASILDEMSSYARPIFRSQPNRLHVRSLVFTEKHVRLVHFDRAGAQISPPIDFNQHPRTLVRLVAGLSSTEERLLGLDDSIQWIIVNGMKSEGTITTIDIQGEPKAFPIVGEIPVPHDSIHGRATTCWRVRDPISSEEFVVKDSWRTEDLSPEHELLASVQGLPGVVEMLSHQSGRWETADFRCPSTSGCYHNRSAGRVLMKCYGKPIAYFTSVLQLLFALRDAIAGHRKLVSEDIRILHRDISHHNVLLGKDGAPEGQRGIIIDLDLAFRSTDAVPKVAANYNVGTRLFQSLFVLNSEPTKENALPHDYLDDLESFFYLLGFIFLVYRPDGSMVPKEEDGPRLVTEWAASEPASAYMRKEALLGMGPTARLSVRLVKTTWGPICGALFDKFKDRIADIYCEKMDLLPTATGDPNKDPFVPLYRRCDEHYSEILGLFDEAIEALKALPRPRLLSPDMSALATAPGRHVNSPTIQPIVLTPSSIARAAQTQPIVPPSSAPSQPRRSARLRNLRPTQHKTIAPPTAHSPQLIEDSRTDRFEPHPTITGPRRSARLLKRLLEDTKEPDHRPRKVRRTGGRPPALKHTH